MGGKYWGGLATALGLSLTGLVAVGMTFGRGEAFLLTRLKISHFFLAAVLIAGSWLAEGLRTQAILRMLGSRLRLWPALKIHLASNFAASVTPLASGGPPLQTYLLWRQGVPLERSLTMVSARVVFTFGFFLVMVPLLLLTAWRFLALEDLFFPAAMGVAVMLVFFSLFFYFLYRPQIVQKAALRLFTARPVAYFVRDPGRLAIKIEREVVKFGSTLGLLWRTGCWNLIILTVYTFLIWGLFFTVAPVLLQGLGLHISWLAALGRQIVIYFLFTYVPLPGASGVAEVGYASLFASMMPKSLLIGFVAAWRLLTYYLGMMTGAPLLLHLAREPRLPVDHHAVMR